MGWSITDRQEARGGKKAYEIDTNGGDVAFCVSVIGKSEQQARFSNTGISDKQELEEIVVSACLVRELFSTKETDKLERGVLWSTDKVSNGKTHEGSEKGPIHRGKAQQGRGGGGERTQMPPRRKRTYHSGFMMIGVGILIC